MSKPERKKKIRISLFFQIRSLISWRRALSSVIMSGCPYFYPTVISILLYKNLPAKAFFFWFNNVLNVCCSHFQVSKLLCEFFQHIFFIMSRLSFFFWMAEVSRHIIRNVLRELIYKKLKLRTWKAKKNIM